MIPQNPPLYSPQHNLFHPPRDNHSPDFILFSPASFFSLHFMVHHFSQSYSHYWLYFLAIINFLTPIYFHSICLAKEEQWRNLTLYLFYPFSTHLKRNFLKVWHYSTLVFYFWFWPLLSLLLLAHFTLNVKSRNSLGFCPKSSSLPILYTSLRWSPLLRLQLCFVVCAYNVGIHIFSLNLSPDSCG